MLFFLNKILDKTLSMAKLEDKIPECINVFHYRYNEERLLNSQIFKDAEQWDNISFQRKVPTRLIHGIYDESVDIQVSREFSTRRPWCEFLELNSDHGLLSHIDWLVRDCREFFKKTKLI